jgi:hypothetical protein
MLYHWLFDLMEDQILVGIGDPFEAQPEQRRSFPPDWPGAAATKILVDRAVPLFIAAATICHALSLAFRSHGGPNPGEHR